MSSFLSPEALEKIFHPVMAVIEAQRQIPILRTQNPDDAVWAANALVKAGFRILEVTDTIPHAERVIEEIAKQHPEVMVGAGTVMTRAAAQRLHQAGARFIVSPVVEESVLDFAQQEWAFVIPGAMTTTEVHRAHVLGATVIKVFPAQLIGGTSYIKALKSVMPQLKYIPTGGIGLEDVRPYLEAGALAVGLGQHLVSEAAIQTRDEETLLRQAQQFLNQGKPSYANQ